LRLQFFNLSLAAVCGISKKKGACRYA